MFELLKGINKGVIRVKQNSENRVRGSVESEFNRQTNLIDLDFVNTQSRPREAFPYTQAWIYSTHDTSNNAGSSTDHTRAQTDRIVNC